MTLAVLGVGAAGIGAGLAASGAGESPVLVEAAGRPGGLMQTDEVEGFRFDRTGHFLHFRGGMLSTRLRMAGVPLDRIERKSAVVLGDRLVPYPIQYNLWAVGSGDVAAAALADLDGVQPPGSGAGSLGELLVSTWGRTLFELFFRPYNQKLWGRPLDTLPPDCVGRYLPAVDRALVVEGMTCPTGYAGYNATFYYPASGRLADAPERLAEPLGGFARYGSAAVSVDLAERTLETAAGESVAYDTLVATLPLPDLLRLAGESPEPELFAATQLCNVRVGLRGSMRVPHHWVYVPDERLPFHRISFPGNVSARSCPPGCTSVSIEYTPPSDKEPVPGHVLVSQALEFVLDLGLVEAREVLTVTERLIAPAYVVHRAAGRPEHVALRERLAAHGVRLAGRFGSWDYLSMEESFVSGWEAAGVPAVLYA
jgi:protoporphyrinogen oxidase